MSKIKLGTFAIEEYDESNRKHKSTMLLLSNEKDFIYIGDLSILESDFRSSKKKGHRDTLYIAYLDDVPIGMVGFYSFLGKYYLIYAILPKFRGHYYSSKLALEFARYIFRKYPEIDDIRASIDDTNIASIKNANAAGFQRNGDTEYVLKRL